MPRSRNQERQRRLEQVENHLNKIEEYLAVSQFAQLPTNPKIAQRLRNIRVFLIAARKETQALRRLLG